MSDTPRTDEQINGKPCTRFEILAGDCLRNAAVPSEFARTIERELNAANDHIKRMEEDLMDAKGKYAALVADVALYEDRGERIKRLEEVGDVAQSQGGQAVSVEERILFLAESPDCNHPRELRAIAFQVRKLEDRIKQLESENDALRADLLLWEEKEAKP